MWRSILLLGSLAIACAFLPATARADAPLDHPQTAARESDSPPAAPRAWWWRDGAARLQKLMRDPKRRTRADDPDWLRYRAGSDLVDGRMSATDGDVCLVLQENRPDGTDLLTARYTLHEGGALRTYAGAGLNRAKYFHDDRDEPGPTRFSRRNRSTSMGAAAELGAELQFSERVRVNADLRWADLDGSARALSSELGPVAADSLMLGVSVGYRFR
ncbi:MAG TPA: OmpW family outer membrane protein [Steroidobacteraceae bacterium]|nr:OmpW family outer membrane protein [Steroidobacteraceae bacterium]